MMPFVPKDPTSGGMRQQRAAQVKAEMEAKQAQTASPSQTGPTDEPSGQRHVVQEGETLESIAEQHGQSPDAIWDDPRNDQLRERRGTPDDLAPRDTLFIPEEEQEQGTAPVGQGDYVVKHGDCISSIAKDTGHFWEKIWNDPGNAELKEIRKAPNVLLPEDRVTIPEITPKQESGETEMRHRFIRRGEPATFAMRLLVHDEPLANKSYTIRFGPETITGTTGPDGGLRVFIPGNTQKAILDVETDETIFRYELSLGRVDPVESIRGVQQRLVGLGFPCPMDGRFGTETKQALRDFQEAHAPPPSGSLDDATRQALKKQYGS